MLQSTNYSTKQYLKDTWTLLKNHRARFVIFSILKGISEFLPFIVATITGKIIDFLTNYTKDQSLTPFYFYVILIAFVLTFQIQLRFYAKDQIQLIGAKVRTEIRVSAMTQLVDAEISWHENENTGAKIQKINSGAENVYVGIRKFSNEGISIAIGLLGSIFVFLVSNIKYAAFSLTFVIIYFTGEYIYNKRIEKNQRELDIKREKVSGKFYETASNLLTVKSLGLKEKVKTDTINYEKEYFDVWQITRKVTRQKAKYIKSFAVIGFALFILMSGLDVINGLITIGTTTAFIAYFNTLRRSVDDYTNNINEFISIKSAVGRLMTILGKEDIELKVYGEKIISPDWKTIEFKNVTFNYKENTVLENFNLTINRGEKIGVIGKSGSGKSTLVKLILGLYKPKTGQILIDGTPIEEFSYDSITSNFSIVLQESEMFNDSLEKNIIISGKENPEKLKMLIQDTQLFQLSKKLPQGTKTLIGEKGYKVSGGERQRIGIARALYKDAPLVIFDEATSHLDTKTEKKIMKNIFKDSKEKTMLIIAHRISTLSDTDKIIKLENGKITKIGKYKDIIKTIKK